MPLFKAKIAVTLFVEIPVYAENLEDAMLYMNGTDEWKNDGGLDDYDKSSISLVDVILVTDPSQVDFEGDCLCWNRTSESELYLGMAEFSALRAGVAFYGEPPEPIWEPISDGISHEEFEAADKAHEAAWDAYYDAEDALVEKFDEAREKSKGEKS